MLENRVPEIQAALREMGADGWLFAVFQQNDPVSIDLLGLAGHFVSRRHYYLIPSQGAPRRLNHRLEPAMLAHLPGEQAYYTTWAEHREQLGRLVSGMKRLVAQYSPDNQLPSVSRLDAGTADLLRGGHGVELLSSADLVQRFAATWSPAQLAGHRRACRALHEIVKAAFERVSAALRAGSEESEHAIQQFLLERFERAGLWSEAAPNVSVNAHSADPHYQPAAQGSAPIRAGDFLLIDLWAKEKAAESVYADITWVACCGAPSERQQEVFRTVAAARDAAWQLVSSRFPAQIVRGFEVDDAARGVIAAAGYGERFIHRTGHSIGISDHGQGANMDNLETHDTRPLLAMTGFSIEPGIYLEGDFGVRSEINVALTAEAAEITGAEPQRELLRLA